MKEMYLGYPTFRYYSMLENVVRTDADRQLLLDGHFIEKEVINGKDNYRLGTGGLNYVNALEALELSRASFTLAYAMLALGIAQLALAFLDKDNPLLQIAVGLTVLVVIIQLIYFGLPHLVRKLHYH